MDNLNQFIGEAKLTHREISNRVGNADNWFNDAYNNNEDIYISSFVRVLSVVDEDLDLSDYDLISLFDKKILKIASLMRTLSDEGDAYVSEFIQESDRSILIELIADWNSLEYRKKLEDIEKKSLKQIVELLPKDGV